MKRKRTDRERLMAVNKKRVKHEARKKRKEDQPMVIGLTKDNQRIYSPHRLAMFGKNKGQKPKQGKKKEKK